MAFAQPATLGSRVVQTSLLCPRNVDFRKLGCGRNAARMSFDAGLDALRSVGYGAGALPGTVYLVGAGPGDRSLLTLAARDLIARADVILYDRLAGSDTLRHARPDATLVYVGKRAGYHTRSQEEISALLAAFAGAHDIVVRLKGGDPFVYGRGGEEADFLRDRGVRVQVVPGITAASAVAAELGFPLTHRGVADSLRFVTGHARSGGTPPEVRWEPGTTLVMYMALAQLPVLLEQARNVGMPLDTPAVAVEQASTPKQRVTWGTARTLTDNVQRAQLKSPTLVVVGDVVALAPGYRGADADGVQNAADDGTRITKDQDLDHQLHNLVGGLREEDRALLIASMMNRVQ